MREESLRAGKRDLQDGGRGPHDIRLALGFVGAEPEGCIDVPAIGQSPAHDITDAELSRGLGAAGGRVSLGEKRTTRHPARLPRDRGFEAIKDLLFGVGTEESGDVAGIGLPLSTRLVVPAKPQFEPIADAVPHQELGEAILGLLSMDIDK